MKPIWIKLILLLLNVKEITNRRASFFDRNVSVSVKPGRAESELQVFIGTLEILLMRRDDILQSLLTRNVGGVVMGHLTGSFYSGVVTEKQDCNVRQVKMNRLLSINYQPSCLLTIMPIKHYAY